MSIIFYMIHFKSIQSQVLKKKKEEKIYVYTLIYIYTHDKLLRFNHKTN